MPMTSTLQRILAPLGVDDFVEQYFQRRPLRIKGEPGKFDTPEDAVHRRSRRGA